MRFRLPHRGQVLALATLATPLAAPAAGGQIPQRPQFRAEVEVVRVQVSVRDRLGAFVPGLRSADFRLRVDGQERPVLECLEIDAGQLRADAVMLGAGGQLEPVESVAHLPRAARRRFLLFLDLVAATRTSYRNGRKAAQDFVDNTARAEDLVGLATYSDFGGLHVAVPFTTDHAAVVAAIRGEGPGRGAEATRAVGDGIPIADIAASIGGDVADAIESIEEERWRVAMEIFARALAELGETLSAVPGRKNVIFLSRGLPDVAFENAEFPPLLERATRSLRESDAVLNAFHPDRLPTSGVHDISRFASGLDLSDVRRSVGGGAFVGDFDRQFLNYLADETDGVTAWYRHNLDDGFRELDEATRSYYVLAYQRAASDPAISTIDVELQRQGVEVRWASRFARTPAPEPTALQQLLQLASALDPTSEATGIELQALAIPLLRGERVGQLALTFSVGGEQIRRLAHENGGGLTFQVLALAVDPSGRVIDYFSNVLRLTPEALSAAGTRLGLAYYDTLVVPPGTYGAKLVVRVAGTAAMASRSVQFQVPAEPPARLWMSRPVAVGEGRLIRGSGPRKGTLPPQRAGVAREDLFAIGDLDLVPLLGVIYEAGTTIPVLVQVRNLQVHPYTGGTSPSLAVTLERVGGSAAPVKGVVVRAKEPLSDDAMSVVIDVPLPPTAASGSYELVLRITDILSGTIERQAFPLTLVGRPR